MAALAKLAALRAILTQQQLQGFILPLTDEYQNEYVPPSARRVEWLTGFTGSAGSVAVLADKAAFFTDSRYTLQAAQQVSTEAFALHDSAVTAPSAWLAEQLPSGARVGYDPWLHSVSAVERLRTTLPQRELVALAQNPVDVIWAERPAAPLAPVVPHGLDYAGVPSAEKRAAIAAALTANDVQALIVTDPSVIAWLLNVRGGDVPHCPLPLSYGIMLADGGFDWFIDARKLTPELRAWVGEAVRCHAPDDFLPGLRALAARGRKLQLDPASCPAAVADCLAGVAPVRASDPCALPRACKNQTEQAGMRAAHRRDAVALAELLAWLAAQAPGTVTELQVEAELAQRRQQQDLYCGSSFDTIAGSGPHGAIVHYRATPATNRTLQAGELFLLDSGGQYRDGTTDVTRTVAIGTPSAAMRDHYTRVVKGHIALAAVRFPAGTTGAVLDVLARQYLWQVGLDYGHGTGHGVGSYLSVHEGPQGISARATTALKPGMVLSNEPGYYRAGEYGIRFENLMLVTSVPACGDAPMLGFETLTLVPLDRALLDLRLLTVPEIAWIDAYHAQVRAIVLPQLTPAAQAWLQAMTEPLLPLFSG